MPSGQLGRLLIVALAFHVGCSETGPPAASPAAPRQSAEKTAAPVAELSPPRPAGHYGKTDEERVADVHTIAQAIEEYRRRTGRLPFDETFATLPEGAPREPINVNLTKGELPPDYRSPPPGAPGAVVSGDEFVDYLRRTLGPGFDLPVDPAPAPRFYQVHFDGRDYYVSAALFEPTEHTLPMTDDWHKYQVGSRPDPELRIRYVDEVLDR
jgi:hypothetical protein